jgi:hypothetical protein
MMIIVLMMDLRLEDWMNFLLMLHSILLNVEIPGSAYMVMGISVRIKSSSGHANATQN